MSMRGELDVCDGAACVLAFSHIFQLLHTIIVVTAVMMNATMHEG
ncbi:hypothetical protein QQ054_36475 [Oscillatoria amoena NRMC-F 0135]|nr:hypothetical protein [Oscillatoria amoena NRMC-F 0135]